MKFTILGFSHPAAYDLGLDVNDLAILRWFIDFKESGYMNKKVIDGKEFYLVIYEYVLEDLPILYIKKDAVYRRFKKMCDKKILERRTINEGGKFPYFAIDENYAKLVDFTFIDEFIANLNKDDDACWDLYKS